MQNLAGAVDCEQEDRVRVRAARRAKLVGCDDRGREAGESRRIGREIVQKRGDESACSAPQRQGDEEQGAVLREARGQNHDHHGADQGADHAVPPLAQRSPKMWLTDERGCGPGPKGIVELEPERDVEGKTDRGPKPQPKEQRGTRGPCRICQSCAQSSERPPPTGPARLAEDVSH